MSRSDGFIPRSCDRMGVRGARFTATPDPIAWAIAEGRKAARGIDQFLMGETELP